MSPLLFGVFLRRTTEEKPLSRAAHFVRGRERREKKVKNRKSRESSGGKECPYKCYVESVRDERRISVGGWREGKDGT